MGHFWLIFAHSREAWYTLGAVIPTEQASALQWAVLRQGAADRAAGAAVLQPETVLHVCTSGRQVWHGSAPDSSSPRTWRITIFHPIPPH